MINFTPSKEQIIARDRFRAFAADYIIPARMKHDQQGSFPHEIMSRAWEERIFNGPLPEQYGGSGCTWIESALCSEELGAGCVGMGITIDTHTLAFLPLLLSGGDEQKKKLFSRITGHRLIGAFCLTEPGAGSDIGSIETTALRKGSSYFINGRKRFITNGEIAGFHTVFAKTDPTQGARGISIFFVPADTEGIKIVGRMDKMGQRAAVQNEIAYENVEIPAEYLIGPEGAGFKTAMNTFNRTRISIAALSLGNARSAWEYASAFAERRIQFGKPVTANQGVSFKLADMLTELHAARGLIWNAASAVDSNDPQQAMLSSMAKYYATDRAMRITEDAIQVMGGEGYSKEHPVEKMMRDAKLCQIYEGTNEIQKVIISKNMFS